MKIVTITMLLGISSLLLVNCANPIKNEDRVYIYPGGSVVKFTLDEWKDLKDGKTVYREATNYKTAQMYGLTSSGKIQHAMWLSADKSSVKW